MPVTAIYVPRAVGIFAPPIPVLPVRIVSPTGFTGVITTAKLTSGGTAGSMTFVNGQLVSDVQAT